VNALPEPRSHTGCATCRTSRCCVVFDPELTGSDLLRILSLGLRVEDVADLRPVRADLAGPDAIHLGDACAFDLRLRRTSSPRTSSTDPTLDPRRCGFLVTLGDGRARCGIYAERPLVCRLFPSELTRFGVMVLTPESVCPPDAFAQERSDLSTLHALHLIAETERAAFRFFLLGWNVHATGLLSHPLVARRALFFEALLAFTSAISIRSCASTDEILWASALSATLTPP
jgi:Fe-S-cluster containining protein